MVGRVPVRGDGVHVGASLCHGKDGGRWGQRVCEVGTCVLARPYFYIHLARCTGLAEQWGTEKKFNVRTVYLCKR